MNSINVILQRLFLNYGDAVLNKEKFPPQEKWNNTPIYMGKHSVLITRLICSLKW